MVEADFHAKTDRDTGMEIQMAEQVEAHDQRISQRRKEILNILSKVYQPFENKSAVGEAQLVQQLNEIYSPLFSHLVEKSNEFTQAAH